MEWSWDFHNSTNRYRITSKKVKVAWMIFFCENVINLVTIESKGETDLWKQIQRCCVCFWGCRSHRCWYQHRPVQNLMWVQPEIKMVDGKPERLKPDIADGKYVNFNGIRICFVSNNIDECYYKTTLAYGNKLKMAACLELEVDI